MAKVSVDVPDSLKQKIEETAQEKDYKSPSEYIRHALRQQLERDEEIDIELLYRYINLQKEEELDKAKDIDQVREELT
ncbi:MAG: hypothetical protein BRC26_02055 [Nanohaloarchaea archaeon QH_8_44_6]|nr:MAG: hypothetical protein BRC26_02055 [Nanohaloarchaea archaeon QH_8_44_6]